MSVPTFDDAVLELVEFVAIRSRLVENDLFEEDIA